MFLKRETSGRLYLSAIFTVIFMLYSNAFADDYTQWNYWTKITINTTVITGLTAPVTNFPLLVRLTSSNFDFTKAKAGGADIRFSNSADTHLFYEIERWDATNRLAEIWVLVDNVANNNNTQYIKMYWGNTAAADSSKPADVYQITNNFAAVWHLNEDPAGAVSGAIKDRTSYGNHGTSGGGMTTTDLVNGMIGKGIDFNGGTDTNDYINVGSGTNLDNMNVVTVSAWIYPQGWGGLNYGRILNKTDAITEGFIYMLSNYGGVSGGISTFAIYRHRSGDTTNVRGADSTVRLNQWNYIVGVMNGTTSSKLYINGSEVSGYFVQDPGVGTVTDESAYPMYIGNRQNPSNSTYDRGFDGIMDEINISNNIRSNDWIKLNYETQKSSQTVVGVLQTDMPSFTLQPVSDTVYQGDPASFSVAVTGTPAPTVKWQKKQGSGNWGDIPLATSTTYSITAAAFSDSGSYRAIATNTCGSATSSEARLLVISSAPAFLTHPQSQNVSISSSVSFKAVATGNPLPTYRWQKRQGTGSWTYISGATDTIYSIASVAFADSGSYRAVATNSWDSAFSNSAQLRVLSDAPAFTTQPVHDTAHVGTSASFSVTVSGNPTPTTKWQKRNTSGVWDSIAAGTTYTKAIVSFSDSGSYRAVATNILGSATSDSAHLLVWDSTISLIVQHPKNDTVLAGDTATFSVVAPNGLSFQWQRRVGTGNPDSIAGATSSTYKFKTQASDNNNWYRCIVTAGLKKDTSSFGVLTIGTIPTITSNFPEYTVLTAGNTLSLTGAATAIPAPTYKWCFIYKTSPPDTNIGTGPTFQRTNVAKADSGTYYFMARNRFGSKNSDSIIVHVLNGLTKILPDLPSEYFVLNGGEMALTFNVIGDGQISYQWYWKGAIMTGQTSKTLRINPVDSATYHNTTFYCIAISSFLGTAVDTLQSATTTLKISKFTNPFKIFVERVDTHNTTQVRVSLWSDVNISSFPSTLHPLNPWADSLWLIYQADKFPVSTSGAKVYRHSISRIKSAAPNPVMDTVTVGEVPLPGDSCFYFSYSVNWHRPGGGVDTLLTPLTNANKVFMPDTTAPPNYLVVHGIYKNKTDTVSIIIDSIDKIDSLNYAFLVVQCSKDSGYQSIVFKDTILASTLVKSGNSYTIIWDSIGTLPIETDTIYCRWFLKAKQTAAITQKRKTTFTIGWDRPLYAGKLTADSTYVGDRIHVEWDAIPPGTEKIRIWWDIKPIDLTHTPLLTIDHAFDSALITSTRDTIGGFNYNTMYHFGLQIFKDAFWSVITPNSSDSAKTAKIGTDTIINIIKIESNSFDTVTNSMVVKWNIDLSNVPTGRTYESGYTYTLNASIDTTIPPAKWDAVTVSSNEYKIALYPDITFETSYTVGLWLRAKGLMFPGGLTLPSKPTDESRTSVAIPSFTWQEVRFFPTDSLVYAANKKIILKRMTGFSEIDTCKSFKNYTLPKGFFAVGGVCFEFKRKLTAIPSFKLGLKHGALPAGIKQSDVGFYRIINGDFHVLHGFDVSNITSDSTVWYTVVPQPPENDLKSTFIILADTLKPKIGVASYSDTIPTGNNIPTYFTVIDNVANVHWAFKYGSGDKGYVAGEEGYLNKSNDSTAIIKFINAASISETYGVRAIIAASDGIRRDTVNVSRQVEIGNGEVFSIAALEWVPLRTTAHLHSPKLDSIFDRSIDEPDPWTYDIYACRLYRWYNAAPADSNYWLEYTDAVKDQFDFVPGRVIWCKTAGDEKISFGTGVTTSLKQPYEIVLKPRDWTDFSLPFQFTVLLRDVLEATAPYYDSLVVCRWIKEDNTYNADYVFRYTDSIVSVKDSLISKQKHDGFTVYNYYTNPVTLVIPPICRALSRYGSDVNSVAKKRGMDSWDVDLRWRNIACGENYFKRVICGYKNGEGEDIYGPLPPTLSKAQVRAGVYNAGKNKAYGWVLKRALDKNGGLAFEISFNNNSGKDAQIEYYLDERDGFPNDIQARVYDTKGTRYEDCREGTVSTLAIGQGNNAARIIAVGPENYFERIFAGFLPVKFMKAYPNPFKGFLRIQYRIPFGIREVAFTVYNVQGKVLWHGVERNNRDAGEHIYAMGLGKDILPAGMYILRLSAKDARGKTVYGGEKRITCIK